MYKFINIKELHKISTTNKVKYEKLLNNLLGIKKRGDKSIFWTSTKFNIDTSFYFNNEQIKEFFEKEEFIFELKDSEQELIKKQIINAKSSKGLFHIVEDNELFLSKEKTEELLYKDNLEQVKEYLLNKISTDNKRKNKIWTDYFKAQNEIFLDKGTWPLFIGTYFIKIYTTGDRPLFCPLLVKKVEIIKENKNFFLRSKEPTVYINEKAMFLLENVYNIKVPTLLDNFNSASFNDFIKELDDYFKDKIQNITVNYLDPINTYRITDFNVCNLSKEPGTTLFLGDCLGGKLRDVLIDLINDDMADKLLELDIKDILQNQIKSVTDLVDKKIPIARICQTDPSQEKAIISSLKEKASIIFGPPGTGKSQVIANIIANIMLFNKKALVISEKKVALDVLLERLGGLSDFVLNISETSNSDNKDIFYDKLNNFITRIKDFSTDNEEIELTPLFSKEQEEYYNTKTKEFINYKELLLLIKSNKNFGIEEVEKIFELLEKFEKRKIKDQISSYLNNKAIVLEKFVKANNEEFKLTRSNKVKCSRATLKKYGLNLELLQIILENNFDKDSFIKIMNTDKELVKKLLLDFDKVNKYVPNTNRFISDEQKIINSILFNIHSNLSSLSFQNSENHNFIGQVLSKKLSTLQFINKFKQEIKNLFNIYSSTPNELAGFIDFKTDEYDYVIFDEASQVFLEKALPYLSIAKKIIIAGDDKQMQPVDWSIDISESDGDSDEEVAESLLSYAQMKGVPSFLLESNYRSYFSELTTFSSKHFYNSELKSLDKVSFKEKKPIEIINVNGSWIKQTNYEEAQKMIQILEQNLNKYKKILLVTLNKNQSVEVTKQIYAHSEKLYNDLIENRFLLKHIENIQGDEADLVILSIAYTKDAHLSNTYLCRSGGSNALNVAITRAKEKMIVLKSINSGEVNIKTTSSKQLNIFRDWLYFLEQDETFQKQYSTIKTNYQNKNQSDYYLELAQWVKDPMLEKNLEVQKDFIVGSYSIENAIIDKDTNKFLVGIEFDNFDKENNSQEIYSQTHRYSFLLAKGYKVIRVSEIMWKNNKKEVLNKLINYL